MVIHLLMGVYVRSLSQVVAKLKCFVVLYLEMGDN
jgi:hypothetical protein